MNDIAKLGKGIALVVGNNDLFLHQLVFDVKNAGNEDAKGATNPDNDNELVIESVGHGRSLLVVFTIACRDENRRAEFDAAFGSNTGEEIGDKLRPVISLKNLDHKN